MELKELIRPDHYKYLEWWYFWGKVKERFFHYVLFKYRVGWETFWTCHSSIHNTEPIYFDEVEDELTGMRGNIKMDGSFTCWNDQLEFWAVPLSPQVDHSLEDRKYISVPHMAIKWDGEYGNGWFDMESRWRLWGLIENGNWDWISIKFYDGSWAMLYGGLGKFVGSNGKETISGISMGDENSIVIDRPMIGGHYMGVDVFIMSPIADEKIFNPKIGFKYSETPFYVYHNGNRVGYGMRERTYGGIPEGKLAGRMFHA